MHTLTGCPGWTMVYILSPMFDIFWKVAIVVLNTICCYNVPFCNIWAVPFTVWYPLLWLSYPRRASKRIRFPVAICLQSLQQNFSWILFSCGNCESFCSFEWQINLQQNKMVVELVGKPCTFWGIHCSQTIYLTFIDVPWKPCPLCSIYSSWCILSIFDTNHH